MRLREAYRRFFPVFIILFLLNTGRHSLAQQCLLDREVNLSHTTAEISEFLKEIKPEGKFFIHLYQQNPGTSDGFGDQQ
jgi:hypothetical protein